MLFTRRLSLWSVLFFFAELLCSGCQSSTAKAPVVNTEAPANTVNAPSYSQIFAQTIGPKCTSCHNVKVQAAQIRYDTYAFTMNSGSVVAGNSSQSSLCQIMALNELPPPPTIQAVSPAEVKQICDWIDAGAKND